MEQGLHILMPQNIDTQEKFVIYQSSNHDNRWSVLWSPYFIIDYTEF